MTACWRSTGWLTPTSSVPSSPVLRDPVIIQTVTAFIAGTDTIA